MLKPYQVKIWDYTTKSLIATLEGHTNNVSFACYHPELPIIISGSEDVGTTTMPVLCQSFAKGMENADYQPPSRAPLGYGIRTPTASNNP